MKHPRWCNVQVFNDVYYVTWFGPQVYVIINPLYKNMKAYKTKYLVSVCIHVLV